MRKPILVFFVLFLQLNSFADSPITSTEFYNSYLDIPVVQKCKQHKLDKLTLLYLTDSTKPLDIKLALINKIGWSKKSTNSLKFMNLKLKQNHYKYDRHFKQSSFIQKASADDLICYAYLRSMDNYFDLDNAPSIAISATKKNPNSKATALISAIIKAQVLMSLDNGCDMYKSFKDIKENTTLSNDIRFEAINIIYEYMDLYNNNCN